MSKQKIAHLTQAQQAALIAYRDEWLAIGRSCEPADRATAERAFRTMYAMLGLEPPRIWWCDGPAVGSLVRAIIRASLRANLGESLGDSLGANLRANLRDSLGDNLWANLWDNLEDNLRDNLRANLEDNLRDSLGANLAWHFGGQHESAWPAYYAWPHAALRAMHSPEQITLLNLWLDLAKACGWWEPFDGIVFACERPARQAVDDGGRLHHETGPALLCRDGYGVYSWHGIRVPADVIERPHSITAERIDGEKNTEVRRVMIERMGWTKYIREADLRPVDDRTNEVEGTLEALYSCADGAKRLVVTCPTGRVFALGVPNEIRSCAQAQRWLAGNEELNVIAAT